VAEPYQPRMRFPPLQQESQWSFHYLREIHHRESQSYTAPQSEKSFHFSRPPREYDGHHLDNLDPRASAK
jgi:hypothetical protein